MEGTQSHQAFALSIDHVTCEESELNVLIIVLVKSNLKMDALNPEQTAK